MIPHHSFVGSPDAPRLCAIMHGVLGAGHNLRSVAKRLHKDRPEYAFVLIDLRYHGRSLGAPPPHRLESCVDDLFDLARKLGRAPEVVIGHSLGGKVALAYAKRHEAPDLSSTSPALNHHGALEQIWTLDSDPGAQIGDGSHQVQKVVAALLAHPGPFEKRADAVDGIISEGLSSGLANWLATSLEREGEHFKWRFEMPQIQELLRDYFAMDLWPYLESIPDRGVPPASTIRYELLLAEKSDRWSGSMRERALSLNTKDRVKVHTLPDAGHWVHVDNPDGLHAILSEHLA